MSAPWTPSPPSRHFRLGPTAAGKTGGFRAVPSPPLPPCGSSQAESESAAPPDRRSAARTRHEGHVWRRKLNLTSPRAAELSAPAPAPPPLPLPSRQTPSHPPVLRNSCHPRNVRSSTCLCRRGSRCVAACAAVASPLAELLLLLLRRLGGGTVPNQVGAGDVADETIRLFLRLTAKT